MIRSTVFRPLASLHKISCGTSPVAFIISSNLRRRHLEYGQKIALGLAILPHIEQEAKKRHDAQAQENFRKPTVEIVPPSKIHLDAME